MGLTWALIAVVGFSLLWVLVPLVAAWASHTGRLDPALNRMGRPFRRLVDWLERHPRTLRITMALMGSLYLLIAALAFRGGRHVMAFLTIFDGVALCVSLLSIDMMLRESTRTRRQRQEQGRSPRHERGHGG